MVPKLIIIGICAAAYLFMVGLTATYAAGYCDEDNGRQNYRICLDLGSSFKGLIWPLYWTLHLGSLTAEKL